MGTLGCRPMREGSPLRWANLGVYSLGEAARLVGTNPQRIHRWLAGYRFPKKSGVPGESAPIFDPQLPMIGGHRALGFMDLVELLFIKAFRDYGVTLPTIRLAAKEGAKRWGTTHPFCIKRFVTDGRAIFRTIVDEVGEERLLDMTRSQLAFFSILSPYLKQLDYGAIGVDRWWPLGKGRLVYIDPTISFGRPVVTPKSIPTEMICQAVEVNRSEELVAKWYGVPVSSVRAALEFERSLAA